jgi:hypothetical protein
MRIVGEASETPAQQIRAEIIGTPEQDRIVFVHHRC